MGDGRISANGRGEPAVTANAGNQEQVARRFGQRHDVMVSRQSNPPAVGGPRNNVSIATARFGPTVNDTRREPGAIKRFFTIGREKYVLFFNLDILGDSTKTARKDALKGLADLKRWIESHPKACGFQSRQSSQATLDEIGRLIETRRRELPAQFSYRNFTKIGVGGLGKGYEENGNKADFSMREPLGMLAGVHNRWARGELEDIDQCRIASSIRRLQFALEAANKYDAPAEAAEFLKQSILEAEELRSIVDHADRKQQESRRGKAFVIFHDEMDGFANPSILQDDALDHLLKRREEVAECRFGGRTDWSEDNVREGTLAALDRISKARLAEAIPSHFNYEEFGKSGGTRLGRHVTKTGREVCSASEPFDKLKNIHRRWINGNLKKNDDLRDIEESISYLESALTEALSLFAHRLFSASMKVEPRPVDSLIQSILKAREGSFSHLEYVLNQAFDEYDPNPEWKRAEEATWRAAEFLKLAILEARALKRIVANS